jgi:hypothetical protein
MRAVLAGMVAVLVGFPTVRGADPPADWTHKELAAHLGKKGIKVEINPAPLYNSDGRTGAAFHGPGRDGGVVLVVLCRDEKQARETAGALGGKAFHRGRFAFGVIRKESPENEKLLDAVEAALKP